MEYKEAIWKFPLKVVERQIIGLPIGSKILCVQVQNERPVLYAKVDTGQEYKESIDIGIYGTGHEVPFHPCKSRNEYLGTCMLEGGILVVHIFKMNL